MKARPAEGRALALAKEACAHVTHAITLLERADADSLQRCASDLAAAVARIEQIRSDATNSRQPGGEAIQASQEIKKLRSDLSRVRLLLGHAWEFRAGSSGQAEYTRGGELSVGPTAFARWVFEA
jgi:hypothetical protein